MLDWPEEEIPDQDRLFYRVHVSYLERTTGALGPNVFVEKHGSMSTDWEKYSTAEECRGRAPEPLANGVIALVKGVVEEVDALLVKHTPIRIGPTNRAHTSVFGMGGGETPREHKTMVRAELFFKFRTWVLEPDLDRFRSADPRRA